MSAGFLSGFGFIVVIPVLIAQWIGVIGLGKWQRTTPWWAMVAGTGLTSLSLILMVGFVILASGVFSGSSGFGSSLMVFMLGIGGLSTLGSLVFATGFAVHGLRIARVRDRVNELEGLAAAQAQEIARLRP